MNTDMRIKKAEERALQRLDYIIECYLHWILWK